MTGRSTSRAAAAIGLAALVATSCGSDQPRADPTPNTTIESVLGVPDDHGLDDDLVADVLASTVGVSGVACGRTATGSGFALASDLIVTNAHVILGIDDIRIHTFDGGEVGAEAVAFDPVADLALLQVADVDFAPLPLSFAAGAGDVGMLVGWERAPFPDPTPYRIERPVTVRIEAVADTERIERPAWQLAAEVDIGDSGAALVDDNGDVIGVAFAASTEGGAVGYAVRATEVDALLAAGLDPNLIIPGC